MFEKEKKAFSIKIVGVSLIFIFGFFVSPLQADQNDRNMKVFTDASSNNFPPVNFLDKDKNLQGFGRELSDAVMNAVGAKVKHIHSPHWVEVLEWLESGQADFIHDTGYTKERDKFLDYTAPVLEMPEMIFVRRDQFDITGIKSLKDKKLACVNQHISHLYIQNFPEITCQIVDTPSEGLYKLISEEVDAFVYPEQVVLYLAQNLRLIDKIKTTGEPLRTLTWSMVVKEGNKELLTLLNRGIEKVKNSGEYQRIYDKWWGKQRFFGYTKREVGIITIASVIMAIGALSFLFLLLYAYKLRTHRKNLTTEIHNRTQAEVALQQTEERYRLAMAASKDGLWDWDIGSDAVYYSPSCSELLGDAELASSFDSLKERLHPDEKQKFSSIFESHLEGKTEHCYLEHRLRGANGEWRWVLTRGQVAERDTNNKALRMLGIIKDISERKQIEKILEQQRYFIDKAQEMALIGAWTLEIQDNKLFWSEETYKIFGVPANAELTYEIFINCVHPDDRIYVDKEWHNALLHHSYDIEHRIIVNDEVGWVREKAEFELNEKDECIRAVGFVQDITGYKTIENELKESEQKFYKLFKASPAGMVITTVTEGTVYDMNESFSRITGYSREESIGHTSVDLGFWLNPEDRSKATDLLHKYGKFRQEIFEYQNKSGEICSGLMSAEIIEIQSEKFIFTTLEDITDRKKIEMALIQSEEKFRQFFKNQPTYCYIVSPDGMILDINKSALYVLGYDRNEIIGKPLNTIYAKESFSQLKLNSEIWLKTGVLNDVSMVLQTKRGEKRNVIVSASAVRNSKQELLHSISVQKDITEFKALEKQIQQSQKMEAIGTLSGGIAHDFNNLLYPILGHIEMLIIDSPENSPDQESFKEIQNAALRAKELVKQILAFSRQEKTQLKLIKLHPIVEEALSLIRSSIPTTIDINQDIQKDCGMIKADPNQIHQVIMNLATNAYLSISVEK